jgi:hypothetical protein
MEMQSFFMVYLDGGDSPTWRHQTLESAEQEAKRLSKLFGKKAYVLCTIKSVEIVEFHIKDCRPDFELPF